MTKVNIGENLKKDFTEKELEVLKETFLKLKEKFPNSSSIHIDIVQEKVREVAYFIEEEDFMYADLDHPVFENLKGLDEEDLGVDGDVNATTNPDDLKGVVEKDSKSCVL